METIANEEKKVGLMLAQGLTKKEVARKLGKSVHTVGKQTSRLYEKTGSRNVADITRFFIERYSGIPVSTILRNAFKDAVILTAFVLLITIVLKPEFHELVQSAISSISDSIK